MTYTFELANSLDLSKIGELTQARDRDLQLALNKAGAYTNRLPLDDELSEQVVEAATCILIKKDGDIVWSGPVWTINETTPNTLDVTAVGWLQTLEKRVSKPTWGNPLTYSDTDASLIAFDLLDRSNADSTSTNYVVSGTSQATQTRTRSYTPWVNILNEITALTEIESGFDMAVDPETRELNTYAKLSSTREDVVFDYAINLTGASRSSDTSRICNRLYVYSSIGYALAENYESQALYGTFEEAISLSDVVNIEILQAYADAEIAVRSYPLAFIDVQPRPHSSTLDDARIFEHFNIGDVVTGDVRKGRLQVVRQNIRLFGATIRFLDNGQEQITSIKTTAE